LRHAVLHLLAGRVVNSLWHRRLVVFKKLRNLRRILADLMEQLGGNLHELADHRHELLIGRTRELR
jgi:hypothetical protein